MKKIYKVFLAALMVLSMAALSFQEVNATDYDGFSVYSFTASDTIHTIGATLDLTKTTIFADGVKIFENGVNLIPAIWTVSQVANYILLLETPEDSTSFDDTGNINNFLGLNVVLIVADDPDSFNAWGYTATDTVHAIPDDIDLANTYIYGDGELLDTGYTFADYRDSDDNWNIEETASGMQIIFSTSTALEPYVYYNELNLDIVIIEAVVPEPVIYTITFNTDDGTVVDPLEVEENTIATAPAAPTKEDYTFIGWYIDEELTTLFNFATTEIIEDLTLYAKWSATGSGAVITPEEPLLTTTQLVIVVVSAVVLFGLAILLPDKKKVGSRR